MWDSGHLSVERGPDDGRTWGDGKAWSQVPKCRMNEAGRVGGRQRGWGGHLDQQQVPPRRAAPDQREGKACCGNGRGEGGPPPDRGTRDVGK